jgi:hypothetical protein
VGEETGRRGEVMVEVTVGRRLSEQWRGALPASAAGAGQPWRAVLASLVGRPKEREGEGAGPGGGSRSGGRARRGGRGLGVAVGTTEGRRKV